MAGIVVVGGGFAGATLARSLGDRVEVTLVSDDNSLLFTPMLAEVAAADIDPRHILAPLRQMCPKARIVIGRVTHVSTAERSVTVASAVGGEERTYHGEAIALATGSSQATYGVPGVTEHALGFRTINDALRVRRRLLALLEESTERRDPLLTSVVVVGAGYSGAELSASLADFLRRASKRFYPSAPPPTVHLVDAVDRVVPMLPEGSERAARALRGRGVRLTLGTRVGAIGPGVLELEDGRTLPAATIIWAGGVAPTPPPGDLDVELDDRGRIVVDDHLRAGPNIFALGDVALVPDGLGGFCPPTAQHAIRQATYLGDHLPAMLAGREAPPFRYKTMGELVALGHRHAIGRVFGITVSGFIGWVMWRGYYLLRLPTLLRRARVALDWTLDLVFPPDIADPETSDLGPGL